MRAKISRKNLNYYLRQAYGFTSLNQFFKLTKYNIPFKQKVIESMIGEFTGYKIKDEKLITYNPYTGKNESLQIKNFEHVKTKEELMKELALLHTSRMQMLEQSRKRLLELSKEQANKRDQDLAPKQEEVKQNRERELLHIQKQGDRETELER